MNQTIIDAIQKSISQDEIVHCTVEAEDIFSALEGILIDDMIQLEHGEWDCWGHTDDGDEWRISVTIDNTMATAYFEVLINPHHSGFGMYQGTAVEQGPETMWADYGDLLKVIQESYDFLPLEEAMTDESFVEAGVEDIRGKIYGGDPDDLYAYLVQDGDETRVRYFGISATEVPSSFWDNL